MTSADPVEKGWFCTKCGWRMVQTPPVSTVDDTLRRGVCRQEEEARVFKYREPYEQVTLDDMIVEVAPDPEPKSGVQLKEEGMHLALAASDTAMPDWHRRAQAAIKTLAASGRRFSAEDVTAKAGLPPRPNAMGGVMNAAAKAGWIKKAGMMKAERPSRHANEMRLWEGT